MSEPRIVSPKEARALLEAATPGPWQEFGSEWNDDGQMVSGCVGTVGQHGECSHDISGDGIPAADAQLIAAAPDLAHTTAVLGDEVAALRAKVAEQAAALERFAALGKAVVDLCWRVVPYGSTTDGDVSTYIVSNGTVHRLIGVAQSTGIPAAFRVIGEDRAALAGEQT
jgi:hypothetical protein